MKRLLERTVQALGWKVQAFLLLTRQIVSHTAAVHDIHVCSIISHVIKSETSQMAAEWQHPFVNVFKLCKVDQEAKDVETSGKVALRMVSSRYHTAVSHVLMLSSARS